MNVASPLFSLFFVGVLCGVVFADDRAAADRLDDADAALNDADAYLQELAGSDPEIGKIIRESRRKARNDTERSRGPAAIEGTIRAAAGVLGFGPVIDTLAGTVTAAATAAGAWALGKRRGAAAANSGPVARRREDDDDEPDDRTGNARGARFRGDRGPYGREGGRETRPEAGAAPVSNGQSSGHGYDRPNRSGDYDLPPASASQRAKGVQS